MQNARRSVVNSTTDKHSGVADREMGLGVSTSSGSTSDKGVALSQSSGSSIDSDQSSRLWTRENDCMTESDDDNSDDEMERLETKNFNFDHTSWEGSSLCKLKETGFLNLSNDCLKDLQDRKLSQVVDTLQEFLCNTHKKLESFPHNGCPESQEEKSRQIRTIVLLKNFLKKACDEKDFEAIELVWRHLMDDHTRHETSENLLYAAAERGLVGLCECLIEMGISANGRHLNNYTPLMGASRSGHLDVVQLLCSNQGDASLKGRDGDTALHIASRLGHEKIVRFLAQQGANMEVVNKAGFTPLMEAVCAGHLDVVSALVRHGAIIVRQLEGFKETPLALAAFKGHSELVKFFVEHGTVRSHASELHNALSKAALSGHVHVGSYLIEVGAQVEKQKNCPDSPLILAAQEGHVKFAELLLNHDASTEETNEEGLTPLIVAASRNHIKMVDFLLSMRANINAVTKSGEDALTQAARKGHTQLVELLISHGAAIDRETESGRTALMLATKFCHLSTAQLLISKGADVNKTSRNNDETVLSAACCSGNLQIVQLLLKNGASPHFRLQDGSTMLIEAVRGGHADIVSMLFHLTGDSSSCSSQEENDDDEPEWSSDVQSRSPSVPQLNVSPTHSIVSNDLAIASTVEDEQAYNTKVDSCSEDSDVGEDDSCKKVMSPFFKKSLQMQPSHCQQSKLKIDQLKKQCLRQNVHQRLRRSSLSSESASNNWKHVVAASQASHKADKRLRSGLGSSPKSLLVEQKLYKSTSACEACGCCPATSVEELDKKSLQLLHKNLLESGVEHADANAMFEHIEKFSTSSFISQEKIPSNYQICGDKNVIQCQTLSSTTAHQHLLDSQSSLQDLSQEFSSQSSILYQPSFNIDAQMEGSQETALIIACSKGYLNVVKMLLSKDANLEHKDKKGFNSLLHAASSGHDVIIDLLLEKGAKIEAEVDRTKDTALSLACANGHIKVIDMLLNRGANKEHRNVSDYSPLSQAASNGNIEAMELLLHHGAEINSRTNSKLGISPLMLAAMNGHIQAVKLLLERGSDVNATIETNRNSALTLASFQGHHEIVSLLLDYKANIEHRTKSGSTAMMEAAQGGHAEVAKVLLDRGADVGNFRDTALGIAAEKGHYKFVELLLARHAPIDIKNKKGTTPLWMACYAGHIDVVKALVLSGADADATDGRKVSCLVAALRKGHVDVVRFLVNHVGQLPPDPECQKFQNNAEESEDPDCASRYLESLEIIKKTKEAQEMKAYKNAAILLDELQQEKKLEAKKRAAREKKREKRKQKKKEKVALSSKTSEHEQKNSISSRQESKHGSGSAASDEESSHKSASDEEVVEKENNPGKMIEQLTGMKKKVAQRDVQESIEQVTPLKDLGSLVSTSASLCGMPLQESKTQVNNKCQELIKTESSYLKSKLSSIGDLDDFGLLPQANVVVAPVLVSTPSTQKMKTDHKVTSKVTNESLRDSTQSKVASSSVTRSSSQTSSSTSVAKAVNIVTATMGSFKPTVVTSNSTNSNLKTFTKKKVASISQSSSLKKDDTQTFFISSKDSFKKMKKIDVPARAVSRVIGRAGCNINAIREFSGAKIDLDKVKYSDDAVVTIRGANDGVNKAAELIQALIRESDKDIEQLITAFKQQQTTGATSSFSNDVPVTSNAWKTGNTSLALKNSLAIPSSFSGVQATPSIIPTSNVWENRKIQTALADQNKATPNAWLKPQMTNKDTLKANVSTTSNVWDNSMADGVGKATTESPSNEIVDEKPEPITTFPIGAWKSVSKTNRERSPNAVVVSDSSDAKPMVSQTLAMQDESEWCQENVMSSTSTSTMVTSNSYLSFRSTLEQPSTPTYSTITGSRSMTGEYSPFGAGLFGSSLFGNQASTQISNPVGSSSDISADKSKAPGYRPPSFQARSQTPPSLATFQTRPSTIPESLQAFNIDLNDHFEPQKYVESDSIGHNNLMMLLQSPKDKVKGHESDGQEHNTPSSQALALPMKIISNLNPNAPNFHSRPMSMSPQNILKSHLSSSMYKSSINLVVGQSPETRNIPKLLQSYQSSSIVEANSPYKAFGGDLGMGFPPQLTNQASFYEFSSQRFPVAEDAAGSNGLNDVSGCDGRIRDVEPTLLPYSSAMRTAESRKQPRLQPIGTERNNKKQQIMNSSTLSAPTSAPSSQNLTSNPNMMINLQQGMGNLPAWPLSHAPSLFRSPSTVPAQDSSHVMEQNSAFPSNAPSFNLESGFRGHSMSHHVPSLFDSSTNMMPLGSYVMPNGSGAAPNSFPERLTPQHFQAPNSNPMYYHQSSFSRVPQDLDNWQLNQVPSMDVNDSQLWGMWPMPERN